ncbi:NEDD4-binding protein 2-like 1 isoform X3 [Clupea harengus]|uniref:NEDD4-binding protein 2-like 1 isoform X3 n=1 Tax=Clupea harengus TaxID=7950 RepID=A0A6P8FWT5_CLUHA|nr:NEDD4-binding protein 2-like 1 isoform X3 [Clupea harengus]
MGKKRLRKLVILRGLPGSGKTDKAKALSEMYEDGVIVSTDDYFRDYPGGNIVNFDTRKLWKAHEEAREKALDAMRRKINPVIIDNINIGFWEMYPYVLMGFHRGYFIEFVPMMDYTIEELYGFNKGRIRYEKFEQWESSYRNVKHIYQILYEKHSLRKWKNKKEKLENRW